MIDESKIKYYKEKEVRDMLLKKEKLVYVDDGMTEVMIKKEDIPDYIVMINMECGLTDLKIIDTSQSWYPLIQTMGIFLDTCEPKTRENIIERLIKLQTFEEKYKKVKSIDPEMVEYLKEEMGIEDEEEEEDEDFEEEEFEEDEEELEM